MSSWLLRYDFFCGLNSCRTMCLTSQHCSTQSCFYSLSFSCSNMHPSQKQLHKTVFPLWCGGTWLVCSDLWPLTSTIQHLWDEAEWVRPDHQHQCFTHWCFCGDWIIQSCEGSRLMLMAYPVHVSTYFWPCIEFIYLMGTKQRVYSFYSFLGFYTYSII